jgi:signal transduction histidine kinase
MKEWIDAIVTLGILPFIVAYLLYNDSKKTESTRLIEKERNEIEKKRIEQDVKELDNYIELKKNLESLNSSMNEHISSCKK